MLLSGRYDSVRFFSPRMAEKYFRSVPKSPLETFSVGSPRSAFDAGANEAATASSTTFFGTSGISRKNSGLTQIPPSSTEVKGFRLVKLAIV